MTRTIQSEMTWLGLYGPLTAVAAVHAAKGQPRHDRIIHAVVTLVRGGHDVRPGELGVLVDGATMSWRSLGDRYGR